MLVDSGNLTISTQVIMITLTEI